MSKYEEELQHELVEDVEVVSEEMMEEEAEKAYNGETAAEEGKQVGDKKQQPGRKGDKLNAKEKTVAQGNTKQATPGESEKVTVGEEKFKEDLDALVDSEATLSESFREKAGVIFEAAFAAKVAEEVERLEESYEERLSEEIESIEEALVEKVDGFLNYVVESWMAENELAVESGLRAEIAESFIANLHSVFTEHYVDVPAGKEDLVDSLAARVEELEESLNDVMEDNIELVESVSALKREAIISEATADLTMVQADKLQALSESVDFVSEEDFRTKLGTLKESYFGEKKVAAVEDETIGEAINEETTSPIMARYLEALKK